VLCFSHALLLDRVAHLALMLSLEVGVVWKRPA